jgi:ornithine carbamoyltransferase
MTVPKTKRHIVSLCELSSEDLKSIISRGVMFSEGKIKEEEILKNRVIGIYFRKTSTRTRVSFSSAALRLGAGIISLGPNDLQENTGESIEDSTRVLSGMLDGFVARTAGTTAEMRMFASQNRMAVINAMSEEEHPTQAIVDLITLKQKFGEIEGLRVLYIGEGNNTAASLALSLSRFSNTELFFLTPPGYGLSGVVKEKARLYALESGATVHEFSDINKVPANVDVVYTTRWQTTGTEKKDPDWRDIFRDYAVSAKVMDKYPHAVFMHDLPAHRGEEVEAGVLEGIYSIAFIQAENKLHGAKAVLEWCINPS